MACRKILLTKNKSSLVDEEDYERLSKYNWYVVRKGGNSRYVQRSARVNGERKTIYMHREIMNPPRGKEIDHVNGDGLDNRRKNLRVCTHSNNMKNLTKLMSTNSSGIRGVSLSKLYRKWIAYIDINGKRKPLGSYKTKREATLVRKMAARKFYGEFAGVF